MRSTDGRIRKVGIGAGTVAVLPWVIAVAFQLARNGPGDHPAPFAVFALIGAVFLFFVVSEWARKIGWILWRPHRPNYHH
jgi:hypothetical protein